MSVDFLTALIFLITINSLNALS